VRVERERERERYEGCEIGRLKRERHVSLSRSLPERPYPKEGERDPFLSSPLLFKRVKSEMHVCH
jgi:hypothetical protein